MTIAQEKTAVGRIIDRALAKGYLISVNDGEEFTVKRSTKRKAIMDALQSTDADTLVIRSPDGTKIGSIWLVWGNSPDEVATDYTDVPAITELVEG